MAKKLDRHRWDETDRRGKFKAGPRCDGCGKPIGTAYFTDEEVCGSTDGPGFLVCDRARCAKALEGLDVEQRRARYAKQRELNDALARALWLRNKVAEARELAEREPPVLPRHPGAMAFAAGPAVRSQRDLEAELAALLRAHPWIQL